MTVFVDGNFHFEKLDEDTYILSFQESLNDIDYNRFRNQLQESLKKNIESNRTVLIKSSSVFTELHRRIPYQEFKDNIDSTRTEAILVISLSNSWDSFSVINGSSISSKNASFKCYLYDLRNEEVVWLSKVIVNGGILSGNKNINNKLARKIARNLYQEGFVYPLQK